MGQIRRKKWTPWHSARYNYDCFPCLVSVQTGEHAV
jgi:hypothetical protein